MNTITQLTIELASNPNNTLCEEWLLLELVDQRDMNHSEARRHIEEVKRVGLLCAELLGRVQTADAGCSRIKKRSR